MIGDSDGTDAFRHDGRPFPKHYAESVRPLRAAFREHFDQTYADTGRSYEDYAHAYRHGCDLASDPQCTGKAWDEVKPYAREKWEAQNPGSFGEYEQAIGAGYATVGGCRRLTRAMVYE